VSAITNASLSLSTAQFCWTAASREFTADASDIGYRGEGTLVLTSTKTGHVVECDCTTVKRDAEGDIQWWTFDAYEPHDFTVIVFND
jgi:hypothetical protein